MARNEARRQKQLAKKKAKRKEKRSHLARVQSPNSALRLTHAETWPIEECLVPENLWREGIGQLVIARRQPHGQLACGVFLVDTYCLGVKDVYWHEFGSSDYQEFLYDLRRFGRLERVAPEYFAKLILDAAAFARSIGLATHPDFRIGRLLLGGIDISTCEHTFTFGKDGKPLYVRGPNESMADARKIAHQVKQAGGEYVIAVDEEMGDDFGEDNWSTSS